MASIYIVQIIQSCTEYVSSYTYTPIRCCAHSAPCEDCVCWSRQQKVWQTIDTKLSYKISTHNPNANSRKLHLCPRSGCARSVLCQQLFMPRYKKVAAIAQSKTSHQQASCNTNTFHPPYNACLIKSRTTFKGHEQWHKNARKHSHKDTKILATNIATRLQCAKWQNVLHDANSHMEQLIRSEARIQAMQRPNTLTRKELGHKQDNSQNTNMQTSRILRPFAGGHFFHACKGSHAQIHGRSREAGNKREAGIYAKFHHRICNAKNVYFNQMTRSEPKPARRQRWCARESDCVSPYPLQNLGALGPILHVNF